MRQQILLVLAAVGMALEGDEASGEERRRRAHRGAALVERLGGLEPVFGQLFADPLIHEVIALRVDVTVGVVEHLHGVVGVTARTLRLREQVRGRFLIAIVLQNEDAALRAASERPRPEVLLLAPSGVVDRVVGH